MQTRLLLLVLRPSFSSAIAVLGLAIGLLIAANWPYFTYNASFYAMFYGDFGIVTTLERTPAAAFNFIQDIGENKFLYIAGVGALAALGGWAAYILVRAIHRGILTAELLEHSSERISTLEHIAIRIFIAIMWFLFGFITIGSLIPLGLLMSRIGAESITTFSGILLNLGAVVLLTTVFHFHIVFLRLFLLRPRVFGGKSQIESTAFPTHDEQN